MVRIYDQKRDLPLVKVTDELVRNVTEAWGRDGAEWLDGLPGLVAEIEREWSVRVGAPFDLSYAYVAPAVGPDGAEVVLKLRVPNDEYRMLAILKNAIDHNGTFNPDVMYEVA